MAWGKRRQPVPTDRQMAVFEEVCRAGSVKVAAHRLGLSEGTVKNHLRVLYERLGADSAAQAAYLIWGPGRPHSANVLPAIAQTGQTT